MCDDEKRRKAEDGILRVKSKCTSIGLPKE
jgi:hypothetical protein